MSHRIERKGAAPAPTPPALPLRVHFWKLRQNLVHRAELVLQLNGPEVVIRRLREVAPTSAHSAIVHMQDREAMLRQYLVEKCRASLPGVLHRLCVRPPIRVVDQRYS